MTSDDGTAKENLPFYILLCAEGGEREKEIFPCVCVCECLKSAKSESVSHSVVTDSLLPSGL